MSIYQCKQDNKSNYVSGDGLQMKQNVNDSPASANQMDDCILGFQNYFMSTNDRRL